MPTFCLHEIITCNAVTFSDLIPLYIQILHGDIEDWILSRSVARLTCGSQTFKPSGGLQ